MNLIDLNLSKIVFEQQSLLELGSKWVEKLLLSNTDHAVSPFKPTFLRLSTGELVDFGKARLLHSSVVQRDVTDYLKGNENMLMHGLNQFVRCNFITHRPLFVHKVKTVNIALAIFEAEKNTLTGEDEKQYMLVCLTQNAESLYSINVHVNYKLTGTPAQWLGGMNSIYTDMDKLIEAVIPQAQRTSKEALEDYLGTTLIGNLQGLLIQADEANALQYSEEQSEWAKGIVAYLGVMDATVRVEMPFFREVEATKDGLSQATYHKHHIEILYPHDANDTLNRIDVEAMVKKHLDPEKLFQAAINYRIDCLQEQACNA